jgi:hypothetical protein
MIKLTKININPNSEVDHALTIEEYRNQNWKEIFNAKSPPIDYWVVGEIISELKEGLPIIIERWNRNGVVSHGIMTTSVVDKIEKNGNVTYITTANSLYQIENVSEEEILNITKK